MSCNLKEPLRTLSYEDWRSKMSSLKEALTCPYIDKEKAALYGTVYFCDFDNMEFDSMPAHCGKCEMYENLLKRAERIFLGDNYDG